MNKDFIGAPRLLDFSCKTYNNEVVMDVSVENRDKTNCDETRSLSITMDEATVCTLIDSFEMCDPELLTMEKEAKELLMRANNLRELLASSNYDISVDPAKLEELTLKNSKLKYRLTIIKRAISNLQQNNYGFQISSIQDTNEKNVGIQDTLTSIFTKTVDELYPDVSDYNVTVTQSSRPQFGDYQCNAALALTKQLKLLGKSKSPKEVADEILNKLPISTVIDKVEVVLPGYLNIWLSKQFCEQQILHIIRDGVKPPRVTKKHRVVVDFSSPNIAKEMHVGHLRSTIIGDSICRLLEFLGHDVVRTNHVGDWGTQFGMLIAHLHDEFPDFREVSPPISDLQTFYKQSKVRFDSDEEFKAKAYNCVVKLQNRDPDYMKAWNLICEVSRKEMQLVYDKLDVKINEKGESFYQERMVQVVDDLESQGFLEEDEGRKIFFGLDKDDIPFTVVKSDGGFTYDTSDLAALKYRIEEERASWIIVVTDIGQATHFKVLKSCGERAGFYDPKKVRFDHVVVGVVLGEDKKKFKTRSGETVRLNDLLEEGVKRSEEKLKEKNRHTVLTQEEFKIAKESVAYSCIKYADLVRNRINDYIFSFDKMLDDRGNTAVYLLYALTRIRSIARNANVTSEQIKLATKNIPLSLDHEKEWKLAKTLLRLNDIITKITQDLCLHHLCEFIYDVAISFTEFYDVCYCIEKDPNSGEILQIHMGRILLCEATALVMEKGFELLGLKPVSKM